MSMPITTPRLVSGTLAVCLGIGSLAGAATWQSDATLPGAKRYAFGARQGGTIYAIGGTPWVNGSDQDGTVYARSGGTWTELPPLDGMGAIIPLGGGVDDLGRIVMFGGIVLDNGEPGDNKVYDPIEGPQDTIADPSADAQPLGFAVATDDLGRLYWLGGGNGAGGGNSAHGERYTGSTDSWQTIADMPAAVAEACACFDGNGHVLVFGGFVANGSSRTADVKQYDVASNTWSDASVPDMPVAVSGARAVRGVDDRIY
ncbi:MAG: hypothetical protein KDA25_00185, partial [Phycisphaerales bacterium]|nr:hypothetical protein [Phycisphaerales bacterium]